MVPEDIKASGKLIVGVNVPYTPNEFKDPSGKIIGFDVDLMNAIASTLGLTAGVPRGGLRQDHPGDPGRHLQRRDVLVHRHQGARAGGRLRHLLLRGICGRAPGNPVDPDNACGKKVAVQATTTQETEELPARSKTCTDAGQPAIRSFQVRRPGRGGQRRDARSGRRDVGGFAGDLVRNQAEQWEAGRRPVRSSMPRRTAGR